MGYFNAPPNQVYSLGNIGGGSDFGSEAVMEPWQQWANNNLINMLWQGVPQGVDLSNILGPNWQESWDGFQGQNYADIFGPSWNTWTANAAANGGPASLEGLNVTADTLKAYLDRLAVPTTGLFGMTNQHYVDNAQYLPHINDYGMVQYNMPEKDQSGILDKLSDKIVPASMAAVLGLGAGDLLGGLSSVNPTSGLSDIIEQTGNFTVSDPAWGVNSTGSFSPGSYNPADPLGFGGDVASNVGNLTTPVGDFTASQLPGGALNATGAGVLGTGAGGLTLPNLPTPSMPPAQAELPANNATPGNVTGATGTTNPVTAGAAGTSGALGTAANVGSAATSAISRILGGTATAEDWASVLGTVGSTALGVYGSNQQANALTDIANQARADRQPFLNKSLEWLNNPQAYQDTAGKSSLDAVLRGLSVQGNPFGSPTNIALAGDIANRNWQNAVTGFGNIGLSGQDSRNSLLASAAGADRGVTASLASGLGSLTQPDNSLEGILRRLQGTNSLNLGNYLT